MSLRCLSGGNVILTYTAAGIALAFSVVIIIAVLRQKTIKAFQKNTLIFSILLLVCAIISNIIITVSAGLITEESSFVYTKKIQAMFDIFMGIMMGAFVVSMAVPKIDSGRSLLRYLTEKFPNAYFMYCLVMAVGLAGVFITPVNVVVQTDGVYYFEFPEWFLFTLFMVVLAVIIFIPVKMRTYLKKAKPHKHIVQEAYMITLAVIGYALGEMFFEIILPGLSIDLRSVGFVIQISLVGMIAYAIRDKTFLQDLLIPVTEADLKTKKTYDLPGGYSYLVEEQTPSLCFEVFKDLVTHGNQGLCITRTMPEKVRGQYGLEKTPIIWLTRVADSPDTVRPYPVGKISETVQLFISAGEKTVVLLDGVEYLILHNDFKTVLTSLQDLNEYIAQNNSILILPVDSEAMESKQFALLRRDLRMIEKPPKIRGPEKAEEPATEDEEAETFEMVGRREKAEVSEGGGFKQGLMLLVCSALAFSLVATSSSVVLAKLSEPHFSEGDSWTYSAKMTEQSTIDITGTISMEILGENTIHVGSSSYSAVENEVSGEGTFSGTLLDMPVQGDWTMTGTEYWDPQSNERVSMSVTSEMDGTVNTGMGLANLTISSTITTETEIISDGWEHPIDVGQTGTVQVNLSYNLTVLIEIEGMDPMASYDDVQAPSMINYECTEKTKITVEAGTYEVYVVEITNGDGSKEINFHLPEAGAGAWIERYDPSGEKIGDYTLKSFAYRGADEPAATYLGLALEYWILIAVAGITIGILSIAWFLLKRKEDA
ncbi:MAG: DUF835 domain-containing protein [Thermoplasmata archaeon]|nr:DUF835 domain-containing protein [Thermoplasmata archaeon]